MAITSKNLWLPEKNGHEIEVHVEPNLGIPDEIRFGPKGFQTCGTIRFAHPLTKPVFEVRIVDPYIHYGIDKLFMDLSGWTEAIARCMIATIRYFAGQRGFKILKYPLRSNGFKIKIKQWDMI